jgi:hypothetical protein
MDGSAVLIALGSAAGGALGATGGWVVSTFVGGPVRKFFDMRGEVIRRLTEFANVRARYKPLPDGSGNLGEMGLSDKEIARLEEAQRTLRDLASQMRAFAENEPLAAWFVRWRYDPLKASAGLIGLSGSYDTYGKDKAFHRETVATALRINDA